MTKRQFIKMIDDCRFPNFSGIEIVRLFDNTKNGVRNSPPPEDLAENIIPVLWSVQHLRTYLGRRIDPNSTYRSPAYNRAVGGVNGSYHTKNMAVDFKVPGMKPSTVYTILRNIRKAKSYRGGLGVYHSFCHIDHRGENRNFGNALDHWEP